MKHCRNIGPLHKGPREGSQAHATSQMRTGLDRELLERRAAEIGSRMLLEAMWRYFDKRTACIASKVTGDRVQAPRPFGSEVIKSSGDSETNAEAIRG